MYMYVITSCYIIVFSAHIQITVHCAVNCQTHYYIRQAPITINSNRSRIFVKGGGGGSKLIGKVSHRMCKAQLGGLGNVSPEQVFTLNLTHSEQNIIED